MFKPQDIDLKKLEDKLCHHSMCIRYDSNKHYTEFDVKQFLANKLNRIEKEIDILHKKELSEVSSDIKEPMSIEDAYIHGRMQGLSKSKQIIRKEFTGK